MGRSRPRPAEHLRVSQAWLSRLKLAAVLLAFAAVAYGPSLRMAFVGDDYVFFDETRGDPFPSVLDRTHTAFGWYRPWSREFHFWALERIAGDSPLAFRLVGLALWVTLLLLFHRIVRGIASDRTSTMVTLCAAVMSLWGTPLLWISGSQDLWELAFGFGYLLLAMERREFAALPLLLMALLSKETACVLPGIALAHARFVRGDRWRSAIVRSLPALALVAVWASWHPTLLGRFATSHSDDPELSTRGSPLVILVRDALASVNLDTLPRPAEVERLDVVFAAIAVAILIAGLVWLMSGKPSGPADGAPRRGPLLFAGVWILLGWAPTLAPSISWHAYYSVLGAFGVWAALAVLLPRRRAPFFAALVILAILRAAAALTPSWDWGSEWYLRRAGYLLSGIRQELLAKHPTLEPHTRVFFGRIPNNIGLVAGSSAALRIWYRDPTLSADFMSNYRPRAADAPGGPDRFFRFDSVHVLVEVVAGTENVLAARRTNPEWTKDHENLAMLFLRSGQPLDAAEEFLKLASFSTDPSALLFGGTSLLMAGETQRAEGALRAYSLRSGVPIDSVRTLANELARSAPSVAP